MTTESHKRLGAEDADLQSGERFGGALPPQGGLALADVMRIIRYSREEEGLLLLLHLLAARGEWRIVQAIQEYARNRFPQSPWVERIWGQKVQEHSMLAQSAT